MSRLRTAAWTCWSIAAALYVGYAWAAPDGETDSRPVVTVGIVSDGGADEELNVLLLDRHQRLLDIVVEQTAALTRRNFDVRFPEANRLRGDWTLEGIGREVDRLLADDEVDVVVSLGAFATNDLARRGALPKPTIAVWALDVAAQQLPFVDGTTGVENFVYVIAPGSILRDVRKFREVVPFDTLHVLVDARFLTAIPEVPDATALAAAQEGIELVLVETGTTAAAALERLPRETEAVYITPQLRMSAAEFDALITGLNARQLPTFSLLGELEVKRGVLAGMRPEADLPRIGRRVALNIQRILLGEPAAALPVTIDQAQKLMINMETVRTIGYYPRWRVLIEAEEVYARKPKGRVLTMYEAVEQAVERNLDLRVVDYAVAAGEENVALARSAYKPQIDVFVEGLLIDETTAANSFGRQAERTAAGGLSLSQLIYADGARADIAISRELQESLEWERESVRLDIALETAVAYLNLLRATTLDRVAVEQLRLTESNLELAQRREAVGFSGPSDVYRWRSELATARSDAIAARNLVEIARIALNRLLDRPLEERVDPATPTLADPWSLMSEERFYPYVDNPGVYELFREFSVEDGLANSVELSAFDAAIRAQQRALTATRRSFWAPTVRVGAAYDRVFSRAGTGADLVDSPATPLLPSVADDSWSVALIAGLPLYLGGARSAEARQAAEELSRLQTDRAAVGLALEQRIRTRLIEAATTYPSIELAQEAAAAARSNLDLVTDSYKRGAVSIIELLDAQTAALEAEEFAANALFDFLIDLMEVQRATNNFDFFVSPAGRQSWFERLQEFFAAAGFRVRPLTR